MGSIVACGVLQTQSGLPVHRESGPPSRVAQCNKLHLSGNLLHPRGDGLAPETLFPAIARSRRFVRAAGVSRRIDVSLGWRGHSAAGWGDDRAKGGSRRSLSRTLFEDERTHSWHCGTGEDDPKRPQSRATARVREAPGSEPFTLAIMRRRRGPHSCASPVAWSFTAHAALAFPATMVRSGP